MNIGRRYIIFDLVELYGLRKRSLPLCRISWGNYTDRSKTGAALGRRRSPELSDNDFPPNASGRGRKDSPGCDCGESRPYLLDERTIWVAPPAVADIWVETWQWA